MSKVPGCVSRKEGKGGGLNLQLCSVEPRGAARGTEPPG